ncbi:hypothetical protein SLA2020_066080 [Shorea laevis]
MPPSSSEEEMTKKRSIIFSKSLSPTCISKCLSISKKSTLQSLPSFGKGHAIELLVEDEDGVKWPFKCSIRKKGPHPKAVLRKGWLSFAKAKGLRVHDKVTLYKEIDGVKVFGVFFPFSRYTIEFQRADADHRRDIEVDEDEQQKREKESTCLPSSSSSSSSISFTVMRNDII